MERRTDTFLPLDLLLDQNWTKVFQQIFARTKTYRF